MGPSSQLGMRWSYWAFFDMLFLAHGLHQH